MRTSRHHLKCRKSPNFSPFFPSIGQWRYIQVKFLVGSNFSCQWVDLVVSATKRLVVGLFKSHVSRCWSQNGQRVYWGITGWRMASLAWMHARHKQIYLYHMYREIHEMSPKVWSVANNGYVRGFRGGGGSSLCHNTSLQRLSMVLTTGASPPTPAQYLLGLRYYLELENKHLGRVVPSWKLVRPQGSAESILSGVWYHLALIFMTQQLRLRTVLFTWSNRTCCYPVY